MNLSFKTIAEQSEGLFRDKGSKFIAFAHPVESEDEIRDVLQKHRKTYFDARHHCYAWMLGAAKDRFRANDDGEPNHSAGDPVLGQIRSRDLTNIIVVVVRYFGGVKLGVSGLINAYRTAAADALDKATIIAKEVELDIVMTYNYVATPDAMRLIRDFDITIRHQEFTDTCRVHATVRLRHQKELEEKIALLRALGVEINIDIIQIPAR